MDRELVEKFIEVTGEYRRERAKIIIQVKNHDE